jgi:hypothetical protein
MEMKVVAGLPEEMESMPKVVVNQAVVPEDEAM